MGSCRWPSPRCSWSASATPIGCGLPQRRAHGASSSWVSASAAAVYGALAPPDQNNGLTKGRSFSRRGRQHTTGIRQPRRPTMCAGWASSECRLRALCIGRFLAITGSLLWPVVSEFHCGPRRSDRTGSVSAAVSRACSASCSWHGSNRTAVVRGIRRRPTQANAIEHLGTTGPISFPWRHSYCSLGLYIPPSGNAS